MTARSLGCITLAVCTLMVAATLAWLTHREPEDADRYPAPPEDDDGVIWHA